MAERIASHVTNCLTIFRDLVDPRDGIELNFPDAAVSLQIKDEQSRFKVWSSTVGAHRTGMSSLDYRLRDASHIKNQVINLLEDLIQLTGDASAIAKGEKIPWDQQETGEVDVESDEDSDPDSPDTELGQIAVDIADVVNCLLRLAITIRNPAPHDRYIEAKSTDASHFEFFDMKHVESKFGDIEPWLTYRLGKAISRRRQYLRYRQSHHEKLSHGVEVEDEPAAVQAEESATVCDTVASSIPSHLKEGAGCEPGKAKALTPLIADDGSDAGMSQTSYATSMASSNRLTIPPLPEEAQKGPFQCCFCYMIIVASDRTAWNGRKHVYGDLQPYVCLEYDCVTPEREYPRRHDWIQHVKQSHWKAYKCPLGCELTFSTFIECKGHLEKTHQQKRTPGELDALAKLSEQPLDIAKGVPCPLCHDVLRSIQQYQRHVGRHQEQLSLFALPSLDMEDPDQDEAASSDSHDGNSVASTSRGVFKEDLANPMPTTSCPQCEKQYVPGQLGCAGIFCSEECREGYAAHVERMDKAWREHPDRPPTEAVDEERDDSGPIPRGGNAELRPSTPNDFVSDWECDESYEGEEGEQKLYFVPYYRETGGNSPGSASGSYGPSDSPTKQEKASRHRELDTKPPTTKGPDTDLIDFFESIEQNQTPIAAQPQVQPQTRPPTIKDPEPDLINFFNFIEQSQTPMATQPQAQPQTHVQMGMSPWGPVPSQQTGFTTQPTGFQPDPFTQDTQQPATSGFTTQPQPAPQVQSAFTGTGFGGSSPKSNFQPSSLYPIPPDAVIGFRPSTTPSFQGGSQPPVAPAAPSFGFIPNRTVIPVDVGSMAAQ
ncbi:hypothetical protein DL765_004021 [Monosporascus sp. GIB2]|nr:hypothetical protein DL765_004021 [Monosporascus sp. GIB2]